MNEPNVAPVQGAMGIIVLDTGFERIPGDIAHPATWPFPVEFRVVPGVAPADVISGDPADVLDHFRAAIEDLVERDVCAIATSCGFLSVVQEDLAAYSPVPFAASPLMQVPTAQALLPAGRKVGIIVSDPEAFTKDHLRGVGAPSGTPYASLNSEGPILSTMRESGSFRETNFSLLEADALATAEELINSHPDVGAIVLECANLPPFSAAIAARFSRPVYDAVTLVNWLWAGVAPRRHPQ